jgi:hypothetical protein
MTNTNQLGAARLDGRYALSLGLATAAGGAAGLSFGLARRLGGGNLAYWQSGAAVAALVATIFTIDATRKWLRARRPPRQAERAMPRTAGALPAPPALLALPAPAKPVQDNAREKDMPSESKANAARAAEPTGKVEGERARLQAAGFSDAEISQILVAREVAGAGHGLGNGIPSGFLNNLGAAAGYVRAFVPGLKADFELLLSRTATAAARSGAAVNLALKAVVIGAVAYIGVLEFSQLQSMVAKARADACSARMKALIDTTPMNQLYEASAKLAKDCELK